jgi:thioredoxin reductase (NADPH)
LKTLVVDKGLTAGALGLASRIANYPGVANEISGAELLERMRSQARSFGAVFVTDKVIGVDLLAEEKTVFGNNGSYSGRAVIIATGSMGAAPRSKAKRNCWARAFPTAPPAMPRSSRIKTWPWQATATKPSRKPCI